MISLIFAIDPNNVIGKGNDLPWNYPSDLRYFKKTTLGHRVLMGRRTFESILARLGKPLPGRDNLVATRGTLARPDVEVVSDLEGFLASPHPDEVFVIGGKAVFAAAWPYADRLYVTHVEQAHEGDVKLDFFSLDGFSLSSATEEEGLRFAVYERKK